MTQLVTLLYGNVETSGVLVRGPELGASWKASGLSLWATFNESWATLWYSGLLLSAVVPHWSLRQDSTAKLRGAGEAIPEATRIPTPLRTSSKSFLSGPLCENSMRGWGFYIGVSTLPPGVWPAPATPTTPLSAGGCGLSAWQRLILECARISK